MLKLNSSFKNKVLLAAAGSEGLDFTINVKTTNDAELILDSLNSISDIKVFNEIEKSIIESERGGYIKFVFNSGIIEAFATESPADNYDIISVDQFIEMYTDRDIKLEQIEVPVEPPAPPKSRSENSVCSPKGDISKISKPDHLRDLIKTRLNIDIEIVSLCEEIKSEFM